MENKVYNILFEYKDEFTGDITRSILTPHLINLNIYMDFQKHTIKIWHQGLLSVLEISPVTL